MADLNKQFSELKKNLKNRFWRLNNLYYITDKSGKKVKFRMTLNSSNTSRAFILATLF